MLYELLKSRRSIRKFKNQEVEKEKLDLILKAALMAPSSRSIKPWQFIAVTDKEKLKELSVSRKPGPVFLENAPLAIVVLADKNACDVWVEDTSITATYIQLMAQDLGLGSCWIQIRERFNTEEKVKTADEYIKDLLEIPEQYAVECVIAIGYPDEEKAHHNEEKLLYDKVHFDKF